VFRRTETPIVRLHKKIKHYLKESSKVIRAILLIILLVVLIVFFNSNENKIRAYLINTSYAVYGYSSQLINNLYSIVNEISFCSNERLYDPEIQRENKYLKLQNSILDEQIKLLKSKIKLVDNRDYAYVTAIVTQVTYPKDEMALVLSAGSKDGISIGNIVLDEAGIVGRISALTSNYAVVSLIGNENVKISVITLPSGQDCIVGRRFDQYHLELHYISDLANIHDGNHVISSGKDGLTPYGIPIGAIKILHGKPLLFIERGSSINTVVKIITSNANP
jgi:rod shape-determining protein MreC